MVYFHVNTDEFQCRACGNIFNLTWSGSNKPAVKRFPVECPECGETAGYRIEHDESVKKD